MRKKVEKKKTRLEKSLKKKKKKKKHSKKKTLKKTSLVKKPFEKILLKNPLEKKKPFKEKNLQENIGKKATLIKNFGKKPSKKLKKKLWGKNNLIEKKTSTPSQKMSQARTSGIRVKSTARNTMVQSSNSMCPMEFGSKGNHCHVARF